MPAIYSILIIAFNPNSNPKIYIYKISTPLSLFFKKRWDQRGKVSGSLSHSRNEPDSKSILSECKAHTQIFHETWVPKAGFLESVSGPTPSFCKERQPEKGGDSMRPYRMSH